MCCGGKQRSETLHRSELRQFPKMQSHPPLSVLRTKRSCKPHWCTARPCCGPTCLARRHVSEPARAAASAGSPNVPAGCRFFSGRSNQNRARARAATASPNRSERRSACSNACARRRTAFMTSHRLCAAWLLLCTGIATVDADKFVDQSLDYARRRFAGRAIRCVDYSILRVRLLSMYTIVSVPTNGTMCCVHGSFYALTVASPTFDIQDPNPPTTHEVRERLCIDGRLAARRVSSSSRPDAGVWGWLFKTAPERDYGTR